MIRGQTPRDGARGWSWLLLLAAFGLGMPLEVRSGPEWPAPHEARSHEAFLGLMQSADRRLYYDIVAVYDAHLRVNPGDAATAIERCRFIANALLDEDSYDPQAEAHQICLEQLELSFPRHPEVLLYRLERLFGEEAVALGESLLEESRTGWTDGQRGRLLAEMAWQLYDEDLPRSAELAWRALEADRTRDVASILADAWIRAGDPEKAIRILAQGLEFAEPWRLQLRAQQLVELEAFDHALLVLERMDSAEMWADPLLRLRAMEGAGRVAQAWDRAEELARDYWQPLKIHRRMFSMALASGERDRSVLAYQRLRDVGFSADPVLRHRLSLALAFPTAPWSARDALGLLALVAALAFTLSIPLVFVVPVHYIGLLRGRGGSPDFEGGRRWGILHLWGVGALFLGAEFVSSYVFLYPQLEALLAGIAAPDSPASFEAPAVSDVARASLSFMALLALGTGTLLRRRDLPTMWHCGLRPVRAVVLGLACIVGFGLLGVATWLVVRTLGLPAEGLSGLESAAFRLQELRALTEHFGPAGLVLSAVIAAPVYEEVLFRGIVLPATSRFLAFRWANLLQALLFALLHGSLWFGPTFFLIGLTLGLLRRRSAGLLLPIAVHAGYNAVVVSACLATLGS